MMGLTSNDASAKDINVSSQGDLPTDTVSSIAWLPSTTQRIFATTSWDGKLRLYDTAIDNTSAKLVLKGGLDTEHPCLSVVWCDDDHTKAFGGGADGTVKLFDLNGGKFGNIGQHDASVKSVYWISKINALLSLSHDKSMRVWDIRQPGKAAAALNLNYKVFCSDLLLPFLAIGFSDEKVTVMNLEETLQGKNPDIIESPLGKGSQLSSIALSAKAAGLGVGSIDGRANISKFTKDTMGKLKPNSIITFKTKNYAQNTNISKQLAYPVHDIGFHPMNDSIAFTSGGDGAINFWDFGKRNKVQCYEYNNVPVTRVKMSPDGLLMAYALGYDWSYGIQGYMTCSTKVCVHVMKKEDLGGK